MAPRKENAKATAGKAKKAEVQEGKNAKVKEQIAQKEDAEWSKGAKGTASKDDKAAKDEAARLRKAEAARLLAEEEAAQPSKPKAAAPKAGAKKAPPPAKKVVPQVPDFDDGVVESFSATGIDDALDMLSLVTEKKDKAAVGSQASKLETHPERRFKAAFEAYKEEQLPIIRKEQPGMRLQQYENALYKQFQKSELNPFNQVTLAYDSTKDDKVAALAKVREETARRLRAD